MSIISPAMSDETEVAVVFADVVGSTRLYELLGDHAARDMIVLCVDLMRQSTERNRGTVIKTIGDEILAIFPTGNDAVNAAAEMQHDIGSHPSLTVDGHRVTIRVGCHFGPVVLQDKDIFGSSVHTANRMTSQAKAGQIILTSDTVQRLSPEWQACTRHVDIANVRGRSEEIELYEVLWQQEDATNMLPSIALGARVGKRAKRLRLAYLGREFVLEDAPKTLTMGRAEDNDLIVQWQPDLTDPRAHRGGAQPLRARGPEHERHVRHDRAGPRIVCAARFRDARRTRDDRARASARADGPGCDRLSARGLIRRASVSAERTLDQTVLVAQLAAAVRCAESVEIAADVVDLGVPCGAVDVEQLADRGAVDR